MDTPISRAEHLEFVRRMEDEHKRQNHRLNELEERFEDLNSLTASVASLAESVKRMADEQQRQGKRLETLEGRDGELWRKVVGYVATAAIGILMGYLASQFGLT